MKIPKRPIPFMGEPQIARFHSSYTVGDGCWEWQGTKTERGYGCFYVAGSKFIASRVALALATGQDPGEKHACHSCDNPSCVNPYHLWEGTDLDNVRDMLAKGRGRTQAGVPKKGHCIKCNHLRVDDYVSPQGHARCLVCLRRRDARATVRRAEAKKRARQQSCESQTTSQVQS